MKGKFLQKIGQPNKSISRNVIISLVCALLLRGISIILSPIVTRYIPPAEYGLISTYTTVLSVLSVFVGLMVGGSIQNSLIDFKEQRDKYCSNCLMIAIVSAMALFIPSAIFCVPIANILDITPLLVCLLVPQAFGSFCVGFISSRFMAEKKPFPNFLLSIFVSVSGAALSLLLLFLFKSNRYVGYIIGNASVHIIFGCVVAVRYLLKGKSYFNKKIWKYALAFSIPLIFHSLSSIILGSSDKLMIKYMIGNYEMGIYAIAFNLCSILSVIWSAINSAFIPFYYNALEAKDNSLIKKKINNCNIFFTILCVGFLMVAPEFVKLLFPKSYHEGIKIFGFIVLSIYFVSLYNYPGNYEFYNKKTKWLAIGTIAGGIMNIVLNIIFIPLFGMNGAAIASCISYLTLFISHELIARFVIKGYPYKWYGYLPCLFIVLTIVAVYYFCLNIWIVRWIIAIVALVVLICRVVKKKEII